EIARVGAIPHASSYACTWVDCLHLRASIGWRLGGASVSRSICQHAGISDLRPTCTHRHGSYFVFVAYRLEVCRSLARSDQRECVPVRNEFCRCTPFKIHRRNSSICVHCFLPMYALASPPGTTR